MRDGGLEAFVGPDDQPPGRLIRLADVVRLVQVAWHPKPLMRQSMMSEVLASWLASWLASLEVKSPKIPRHGPPSLGNMGRMSANFLVFKFSAFFGCLVFNSAVM